jgi:tRNA-binding protein
MVLPGQSIEILGNKLCGGTPQSIGLLSFENDWVTRPTRREMNMAFAVAPTKPVVPVDLLEKIDVRVGTIELVEDVKGSDRMVKLTVNFGDRKRTVLVGMKKERANPKEVEGKQALFVVNLEPRKIMSVDSEAMLFDIGYPDGIKPVLATPEKPVPNGVRAG